MFHRAAGEPRVAPKRGVTILHTAHHTLQNQFGCFPPLPDGGTLSLILLFTVYAMKSAGAMYLKPPFGCPCSVYCTPASLIIARRRNRSHCSMGVHREQWLAFHLRCSIRQWVRHRRVLLGRISIWSESVLVSIKDTGFHVGCIPVVRTTTRGHFCSPFSNLFMPSSMAHRQTALQWWECRWRRDRSGTLGGSGRFPKCPGGGDIVPFPRLRF
jgi:hypothetical protein